MDIKEFFMQATQIKFEHKSLKKPDEKREFEKGYVELGTVGGITFGRAVFEPGWKWSTCVKPIAKTNSCQAPHTQYIVTGQLHLAMDDGTEADLSAAIFAASGPAMTPGLLATNPLS